MKNKRIAFTNFYFTVVASVLLSMALNAQPYVDILNLKYRSFPAQTVAEMPGSKITGNLCEASFLLPMEQKNKNVFLFGGDYSALNFKSNVSSNDMKSLYSASLQIGYDRQLKNASWRQTILFLPKFNGDFNGLGKSFQAGGVLMYTCKKKENLKYHFGMYYNREFFGDYFIPLLGIDWKINSRMNLFGDLPNNLCFEVKASNMFTLGTGFTTTISSFRIHNEATSYIREGDKTMGHDQVKIYLNCYASKHCVIFCEAGETINRQYTAYDSSNKEIYTSKMDGSFITGGLAYRFAVE